MMTLYSGTTDPFSHRCRIVLFEKGKGEVVTAPVIRSEIGGGRVQKDRPPCRLVRVVMRALCGLPRAHREKVSERICPADLRHRLALRFRLRLHRLHLQARTKDSALVHQCANYFALLGSLIGNAPRPSQI